ncbi:hypothetical protein [Arthrobacter sp. IK3]|uniref:hypothetical protein n=1 Tax=Arthrobacter sp. IK3 TaxID=3448169 RepID=UPI003EE20950
MTSRPLPAHLANAAIEYPAITTLAELDALPDGSIVMMDPETTTNPVPWARVGKLWVALDPLAALGARDEAWSVQLFRRTLTAARPRKLVLLWMPPRD